MLRETPAVAPCGPAIPFSILTTATFIMQLYKRLQVMIVRPLKATENVSLSLLSLSLSLSPLTIRTLSFLLMKICTKSTFYTLITMIVFKRRAIESLISSSPPSQTLLSC